MRKSRFSQTVRQLVCVGAAVSAIWILGWPNTSTDQPGSQDLSPIDNVAVNKAAARLLTVPRDDELQQACGPLAREVRRSLEQFDAETWPHKNHTLLVLGLEDAYRDQVMLGNLKPLLSNDQVRAAAVIVDRYQRQFDQLLTCRSQLLQSSASPAKVDELLRFNRIATILLTRKVHQRIFVEVLTPAQKTDIAAGRHPHDHVTR